jgi:hypothetical protein
LAIEQVEIPAMHVEPVQEVAAAELSCPAESQPVEFHVVESQSVESQIEEHAPAIALVTAASLAEPSAPIDQQDEPMFALHVPREKMEPPAVVEAFRSGENPPSFASMLGEAVGTDGPAPSDDELAEALRLLTPATMHGGAMAPLPATRWMAESVAVTPEEAATSLAAEMFHTFGTDTAAAYTGEVESAPVVPSDVPHTSDSRQEEAKQIAISSSSAEEAPKAMAAAATAERAAMAAATEAGVTDDSTIASIVDRVLADLRPKIVEEIARKLGKNG